MRNLIKVAATEPILMTSFHLFFLVLIIVVVVVPSAHPISYRKTKKEGKDPFCLPSGSNCITKWVARRRPFSSFFFVPFMPTAGSPLTFNHQKSSPSFHPSMLGCFLDPVPVRISILQPLIPPRAPPFKRVVLIHLVVLFFFSFFLSNPVSFLFFSLFRWLTQCPSGSRCRWPFGATKF